MNSKELFLNRIKEKYNNYTENEYLYYEDSNYYYQIDAKNPFKYRWYSKYIEKYISDWFIVYPCQRRNLTTEEKIRYANTLWSSNLVKPCKDTDIKFLFV